MLGLLTVEYGAHAVGGGGNIVGVLHVGEAVGIRMHAA